VSERELRDRPAGEREWCEGPTAKPNQCIDYITFHLQGRLKWRLPPTASERLGLIHTTRTHTLPLSLSHAHAGGAPVLAAGSERLALIHATGCHGATCSHAAHLAATTEQPIDEEALDASLGVRLHPRTRAGLGQQSVATAQPVRAWPRPPCRHINTQPNLASVCFRRGGFQRAFPTRVGRRCPSQHGAYRGVGGGGLRRRREAGCSGSGSGEGREGGRRRGAAQLVVLMLLLQAGCLPRSVS
jgi:hypothetical protein